jgi:hydroxymethylglutaryl-CoA synthase
MRGIKSAAAYIPYRRLQRSAITSFLGTGGGKGSRSVASHDEDTTTMGTESARLALAAVPAATPEALWFSTTDPAYLDKTNASTIHAALRLPSETPAVDFGGALRSGVGALRAGLDGKGSTLVILSDQRDGLPGSSDEAAGGDAAAAFVLGEDDPGSPVIAELVGAASASDEFTERWRTAGDRRSKVWEERFGETRYVPLGMDAWGRALKSAGTEASEVHHVAVTSMHSRAARALAARLLGKERTAVDDLAGTVGNSGCAHAGVLVVSVLERAEPGELVAVVNLADGADVLIFKTTASIAAWSPRRTVADQIEARADLPYAKFLAWRGMLQPEPPRRPEPLRVQSPPAWRARDWKFAFVGSRDRSSGAVHLPPARVSMVGGAVDDMEPLALAGSRGTIVTFTVDRIAYSPSPPIVFAVVDFDEGGRFPVELTDVDADALRVGERVEMTFRRLYSADGIHDYFWKARPVRSSK